MPRLEFCPSVIDFGSLVCEYQLICRSLTITNTGSKEGSFLLLADQLPCCFTVSPIQIKLEPRNTVDINVSMKLIQHLGIYTYQKKFLRWSYYVKQKVPFLNN